MPVIGVSIRKIDGERIKPIDGPVEIKNNTHIVNVKEVDMQAFNRKGLNVSFEYISEYNREKSSYGKLNISGDVLFIDQDKQDTIVEEWNKTKKLPKLVNIEILNSILRRCVIKSMSLSEDLQLPPPITLPYATEKTTEEVKKN